MKPLRFIIGLRRSYEAYEAEIQYASTTYLPEYLRFLKSLSFYGFVEQVITACAMFPRCIDASKDNLDDLSYGIYNELGIGKFYLSQDDQFRFSKLIVTVGQEVIGQLDSHRYYLEPHELPRGMQNDPHYSTDLTAISDVTQISPFTFAVEIIEEHFESIEEFRQNAISFPRLTHRSF